MNTEQSRLQILLVNESSADREYFQRLLANMESVTLDVHEAESASDALEKLVSGNYDCALVDYNLWGYNGKWLVQEMKRRGIRTASIMLTDGTNEHGAIESLKCGTHDYLRKSEISGALLERSIVDSLAIKSRQLQFARRASVDKITGAQKRELFMQALDNACAKADRFNRHFALLYLDIDNLAAVNERHGRAAGDKVLQVFASQLGLCVRSYDILARLGGDEFVLLLDELEGDGLLPAIRIAKRIRERLENTTIEFGARRVPIAASIGIGLFPQSGTGSDKLVELAEMAMRVAKRSGGGYHVAESVSLADQRIEAYRRVIN